MLLILSDFNRMENAGNIGSRRREGKKYAVEDEALDRIAKEVSGYAYNIYVLLLFFNHFPISMATIKTKCECHFIVGCGLLKRVHVIWLK